ncbi:unnamed protein product [Arabidopsis lyrata]|uniref:Uncharacterized protein n=1 Tax=Arabidopsis lyrata subsp. lyrata TaxID=81972 RepID=D7KAR4_ARALL|nr:defensin-like protein 290 [Arabidopsis lyrata subsp. lyrata]EFH67608.1 hypothetical protein ARALYDRAFT_891507 [Arabidopsis lyrata subsp. lyrata]CAH8254771.1 unnamed protein product [Arabidopsis lyrata]|eukprot:XP_002891349.1 defensin-like protein 290 [Arabidopsis lyrata subsp. lyrata]
MAALKTTIFIIFGFYLSCTLLVGIFGVQAKLCKTDEECDRRCQDVGAKCILGICHCSRLKVETEPTKARRCKTDSDCPDSHQCLKDYYYACLNNGECTCISV